MKGLPFHTAPSAPKRRSAHDLSQRRVMTGDFGQIYPIYVCKCIPGDTHRINNDLVIRFNPLVHPTMHEINAQTFYFFVPNRIMAQYLRDNNISDFDWESYITGGVDGDDSQTEPELPDAPGAWTIGSLLDYLYNVVPIGHNDVPRGINAWPLMAYNMIYNDYFRDENIIDEVNILGDLTIKNRAWTKDYFTSALPFQQRGISPSLPIVNTITPNTSIMPNNLNVFINDFQSSTPYNQLNAVKSDNSNRIFDTNNEFAPDSIVSSVASINASGPIRAGDNTALTPQEHVLNQWLTQALTGIQITADWDINDLRTAWQTQKFLEAMARVGARYTEYLKGIWNVAPRDERLQRPEFIGSSKQPIVISEVLQTSEDGNTPQANMAGHGITADSTYIGTYRCLEWGVIIGLLTVMPKPAYDQGINRQWLCETRYDYPNPYYMHLSERPIESRELYFTDNGVSDRESFGGWQGIWDEYRIMHDAVNGLIRSDFSHWTLVREFASRPILNKSFIECDSITGGGENPLKRIFAVPSEPGMIIETVTRNHSIRPMPFIAEPGLVDH